MKHLFSFLSLFVFLATVAQADPAAPRNLAAKEVENHLGLALHEYSFSWKAPGQVAYQVIVASDQRKLAAEVGDLWNSGMCRSGQQSGVLGGGHALQLGQAVWWKARVWDEEGHSSEWSDASHFTVPVADAKVTRAVRPTTVNGKVQFIKGKIGQAIRLGGAEVSARDYEGLRSTKGTTIAAWIKSERITAGWQL